MVIAADGAMILQAGAAQIFLRPSGDIAINGAWITIKGDQIWLN